LGRAALREGFSGLRTWRSMEELPADGAPFARTQLDDFDDPDRR
jgi:hypothetical protein